MSFIEDYIDTGLLPDPESEVRKRIKNISDTTEEVNNGN